MPKVVRHRLIDEIVREGARRMLAEALHAEVDAYIAWFAEERDETGRRLVVRNGSHQPRTMLTSGGAIEVPAFGQFLGVQRNADLGTNSPREPKVL